MSDPKAWIDKIVCGDTLETLKQMPSEIISCCIFSPPYWSLRDYKVKGQIGLEKTFEEYLTKMWAIFDELWRVLRKDGTMWVNIADTYGGSGMGMSYAGQTKGPKSILTHLDHMPAVGHSRGQYDKSLLMLPERLMLGLLERGWILRNKICWCKPNPMPCSARDRFTTTWEYLFFLTKSKKYWFDLDAVRRSHITPLKDKLSSNVQKWDLGADGQDPQHGLIGHSGNTAGHPAGKNPGDVIHGEERTITTKIPQEDAEKMGSPRARQWRTQKQKERWELDYTPISGGGNRNMPTKSHPAGANPGDVIKDNHWDDKGVYRNRKYKLNESYFELIDAPEKAYWLGFLWADGYVAKYQVDLALKEEDRDMLSLLAEDIDANYSIREERKYGRCRLSLCSNQLADSLRLKGWQDKNVPYDLPDRFVPDFIRGVFDGDGSVGYYQDNRRNKIRWWLEFLGKEKLLQWIESILYRIGLTKTSPKEHHGIFRLCYADEKNASLFWSFIYPNATRWLERKRVKFPQEINRTSDVFEIPTQPSKLPHYASYPEKLCLTPLKAGCPKWICKICGKARVRVTKQEKPPFKDTRTPGEHIPTGNGKISGPKMQKWLNEHPSITLGWTFCSCLCPACGEADCLPTGLQAGKCGEKWRPGIVLDPFVGIGTTCIVAKKLGLSYLGIDIKKEYCEMAEKRLKDVQYQEVLSL